MPYIAPRRPVVTANGTASSVITIVTNGNESLRSSATSCALTSNPLARSPAVYVAQLRIAHEPFVGLLGVEVGGRFEARLRLGERGEGARFARLA